MKIAEVVKFFNQWVPISLQESYDNSGLAVGSLQDEVNHILVTLDVTEEVIQEAIEKGCDMIISHHPVIFSGLKKLNGKTSTERIVMEAIRHNIALFSAHTNLDSVPDGVSKRIADQLGLQNTKLLEPKSGLLKKLVVFVPDTELEDGRKAPDAVREALWAAGAGKIGNYDSCSYNMQGEGTFRPLEGADPYIGNEGKLERQQEVRIEVIYPNYRHNDIITALWEIHPYEEPAYDIFSLDNEFQEAGFGIIGELPEEMDELEFLFLLKIQMQTECVRHSPLIDKPVKRVAVCGGAGSFLLQKAIAQMADVFVSGDFKYHQFFDAEGRIVIADIGHFESEQFTTDLIIEKLREKFTNFAVSKSDVRTNPINYL